MWAQPSVLAVRNGISIWTSAQLAGHPSNLRVDSMGNIISTSFSVLAHDNHAAPSALTTWEAGASQQCLPAGQCVSKTPGTFQCCPGLVFILDVKCGFSSSIPLPRCVNASGGSTQAMSLEPANGTVQWEWDSHILVDDGLTLLPDGVLLLGTEANGSMGESPDSIIRLTVSSSGPQAGAPYQGTTGKRFSSGAISTPDGSLYAHDGLSLYRWNASGPPALAMMAGTQKRFSGTPALSPLADVLYVVINDASYRVAKLVAFNLSRL